MIAKTKEEILALKEGGANLKKILVALAERAKPGVSALELDKLAFSLTEKMGDKPSFLNYKPEGMRKPYPFSLCLSVNEEVVHGLPVGEKILKEGDIAGIDMGLVHKGFFLDSAITVPVGRIDERAEKLLQTTKKALFAGIDAAKAGGHIGDIGFAVEKIGRENGFGVVRDLAGHGVGRAVHEEPFVPNYGKQGKGGKLAEGLVIAIEPMFNEGSGEVVLAEDGATYRTADGGRSAHFEHTVLILKNETIVLT